MRVELITEGVDTYGTIVLPGGLTLPPNGVIVTTLPGRPVGTAVDLQRDGDIVSAEIVFIDDDHPDPDECAVYVDITDAVWVHGVVETAVLQGVSLQPRGGGL
jgi:hypothetical protein